MWEDFDWRYEPPNELKGKPVNDALASELSRGMDAVASVQGTSQDAAWTMGEISGALFLHAVRTGDINRIKELARLGADVNPSDRYCRSSLHLAPTDDVAMALIRLGAEGNLIDCAYRTPLHYAAERGMTRTVQWLLAEVLPAEIPDAYDRTPLDFATDAGQLQTTLALLDAGADPTVLNEWGNRRLDMTTFSPEDSKILEEAISAWKPGPKIPVPTLTGPQ